MEIRKFILLNNLLAYSFILLGIFSYVTLTEQKYNIPSVVKYLISLFIILSFLYYWKNYNINLNTFKSFKIIILLFAAYSIYLLISSFRFNLLYFQNLFGSQLYILPYFFPIIILKTKINTLALIKLFRISIYFIPATLVLFVSVFISLNQVNWLEQFTRVTVFEGALVILFLSSHILLNSHKLKISLFLFVFSIILLSTIYGRRSIFIDYTLILFFFMLIRYQNKNFSKSYKTIYTFSLIILISMVLLLTSDSIFNLYIFERGFNMDAWETSRGQVIDEFFRDFNSTKDWIFGRGLNGQVLRSLSKSKDGMGSGIENGFLHTILKGGLVYLFLQLIIFIKAFYLGWMKSNNDLAKAMASLIPIHIIGMVAFNLPSFSVRYILLWIVVSVLLTSDLRLKSNKEINGIINNY